MAAPKKKQKPALLVVAGSSGNPERYPLIETSTSLRNPKAKILLGYVENAKTKQLEAITAVVPLNQKGVHIEFEDGSEVVTISMAH